MDTHRRRIEVEELNMVNPVIKYMGDGIVKMALHGYCRANHMAYGAVIVTSEENRLHSNILCKRLKRTKYFSDLFEFRNLGIGTYTYRAGMFMIPKDGAEYDPTADVLDFSEAFRGVLEIKSENEPVYRFGVGSCRFFLNIGRLSIGAHVSDKAYRTMSRMGRIQSFMMLGDSVYMDIVKWLPCIRVTDIKNMYRIHRLAMSTPGFKDLFSKIPYYSVPDDHEYRDDANPSHREIEPKPYKAAKDAINTFMNFHGPLPTNSETPLWAYFKQSNIPFFMADTRYERDDARGKIMSNTQMNSLKQALREPRDVNIPFFIMSAAPFALQTHNDDTWAGYRVQQESLVRFIYRKQIKNVFILTGDSHCSVSTRYRILDAEGVYNDTDIVEIMSSGLYQLSRDGREDYHTRHVMDRYRLVSQDDVEDLRSYVIREDNFTEVKVDKVLCQVKVDVRSKSGVKLRTWRFPLAA